MQYLKCGDIINSENGSVRLEKQKISGSTFTVTVSCKKGSEWEGFCISYKYKIDEDRADYYIDASEKKQKGGRVFMTLTLNLSDFPFRQTHWAVLAVYSENGRRYAVRIKKKEAKETLRGFLRNNSYTTSDGHILFEYYSKGGYLGLRYRKKNRYDGQATKFKECVATAMFRLFKKHYKRKKIYLIYEKRCQKAQDNGYHLFMGCMANDVEKKISRSIYYVIEKDAVDYRKIRKYDKNVLNFMSIKFMIYLLASRLLISSDSRSHAYVWHGQKSLISSCIKKKKHVFLGHGVLALKRLNSTFSAKNMNSSLVTVTSEDEAGIFRDELGFSEDAIAVTGYARFDALRDQSQGRREILVMPTHRSWLFGVEREVFLKSEYYARYREVITSEKMISFLKENNLTLNFYLHPSIGEHIDAFESVDGCVQIIPYGKYALDDLMMRCSLLITDYSSVVWDVYYLGKPMLFYQYDVEDYLNTWGSYINLETDCPGERTDSFDELMKLLGEYAADDFVMKPEFEEKRKEHYQYIDNENCRRIWEEFKKRKL